MLFPVTLPFMPYLLVPICWLTIFILNFDIDLDNEYLIPACRIIAIILIAGLSIAFLPAQYLWLALALELSGLVIGFLGWTSGEPTSIGEVGELNYNGSIITGSLILPGIFLMAWHLAGPGATFLTFAAASLWPLLILGGVWVMLVSFSPTKGDPFSK